MTRLTSLAAALMLAAFSHAAGPASAQGELAPRDGWTVIDTDTAFSELVESLTAAIEAAEMGLVTQASASAGAKMQGVTIPGNRVIGVYRNDYARRMLKASVAAGIEAPIRFYVTEDTDGGATLSYKHPSFVFAPYLAEGGDALETLAGELDAVFKAIAEDATN
ncbi:DUF302 domain-containing protein [Stappia sp. ES.058]|uniref:DUF302 domain-containing protein n=1 Tax=Stappia sp. ES.058 TaxID=1881061 RepID=UPI00087D989E|nr:DUF302 domain-containing protein [Stappia sp. ES.058]SDU49022.1 Uncharacterized conserved protein, DUF302 family [Stappia sp. ES.058]